MRRDNPEQRLQMAVAQYLGHALKPPVVWTAIGHGGGGRVRGAILKAMGLQAGWPDILVLAPGSRGPRVVAIEIKAKEGRQSPAQKAVAAAFYMLQVPYFLCRSVDEVQMSLASCDVPLSATVAKEG